MLLLGALRGARPAGPLAVMTLVEAIAAVVCEPGVHTTDPVVLSATLQVLCRTVTCWLSYVSATCCCQVLLSHKVTVTCCCRMLLSGVAVANCWHMLLSIVAVTCCWHMLLSRVAVKCCCHMLLSRVAVTRCCFMMLHVDG